MVVIGDIVRDGGDLRLSRRMGVQFQIVTRVVIGQREGQRRGDRTVMLGDPLQRVPGQVQPVKLGIAALQRGDDLERLRIVIEAAIGGHQRVQRILSGMAKGGVPEIMRKGHGLGQILVQAKRAGDGARDLRHFDGMGQAGAEIIALMFHKHLRLVLEAAKRPGMDDPVAVALEGRAKGALLLGEISAPAGRRFAGIGCRHRSPSPLCWSGGSANHLFPNAISGPASRREGACLIPRRPCEPRPRGLF